MKRKILIIRFSSIGDLILITPVIRCLKMQLDCELHLITKASFQSVLINNPNIDKHWSFNKSIQECRNALINEKFDIVIDLHKNLRSYLLRIVLNKLTYSFNKVNLQKWLLCKFKINKLPDVHLVDRYFTGIKDLKVKNDGNGLDYFFTKSKTLDLPADRPLSYVVGVLGAAHFTKQIPLSKWHEIIELLDIPMVLIGGTNEVELGKELKSSFPEKVINQTGLNSIEQSALWISNSKMVITPDTGMMHIAVALGKPTHVVWGNTIPQFGMYPYFGSKIVKHTNHEVSDLSCRPCSKLGYLSCPKGHFNCMMQQHFSKEKLS